MSHNIDEFVSQIAGQSEFLKPSQFELEISGMPKWAGGQYDGRSVRFGCNGASLPGTNIDSIDLRRHGMGFQEFFPTGVSFFELQTSFYASADAELIRFFNQWTRNIIDFDVDTDTSQRFRAYYRDNYVSQVQVTQFTTDGNPVLTYTYIDAFPVAIRPIGVRWSSRDEITEFEVAWKYTTWREESNPTISKPLSSYGFSNLTIPSQRTGLQGFPAIQNPTRQFSNLQSGIPNLNTKLPTVPVSVTSALSIFNT